MNSSSPTAVVIVVYVAFVLDNVLLTVVVPILPEDLARLEAEDKPIFAIPAVVLHEPNILKTDMTDENEKITLEDTSKRKLHSMKEDKIEKESWTYFQSLLSKSSKSSKTGYLTSLSKRLATLPSSESLDQHFLCSQTPHLRKFTDFVICSKSHPRHIAPKFQANYINKVKSSTKQLGNGVSADGGTPIPKSGHGERTPNTYLTENRDESAVTPISSLETPDGSDVILVEKLTPEKDSGKEGAPVKEDGVEEEVGLVLAIRSLVQLFITPLVAKWSARVGYSRPMIIGCCFLLASTLTFACAQSLAHLVVARCLHGLASSCIIINGLGLVAECQSDDLNRGRMIGRVQGGVALGVVLGYPMGGLLYHLTDSPAPPFVILAGAAALLVGAMVRVLKPYEDLKHELGNQLDQPGLLELVRDPVVATACLAIMAATATFPVLESCLPSHLRATVHPQRWELGAVFLPDSIAYFAAATLLGGAARSYGRPRAAAAACGLVAFSTFCIPFANSVGKLTLPHVGVGLGVGAVDASLLPLLASHVDSLSSHAHYATVYAISQGAVAVAYCAGPVFGVWLMKLTSFAWMMRCLAVLNIVVSPFILRTLDVQQLIETKTPPPRAAAAEPIHKLQAGAKDSVELSRLSYQQLP